MCLLVSHFREIPQHDAFKTTFTAGLNFWNWNVCIKMLVSVGRCWIWIGRTATHAHTRTDVATGVVARMFRPPVSVCIFLIFFRLRFRCVRPLLLYFFFLFFFRSEIARCARARVRIHATDTDGSEYKQTRYLLTRTHTQNDRSIVERSPSERHCPYRNSWMYREYISLKKVTPKKISELTC